MPTPIPSRISSYKSTPPPPPPIIYNNNRMGIEFVVQMRQSNKYGSVRND